MNTPAPAAPSPLLAHHSGAWLREPRGRWGRDTLGQVDPADRHERSRRLIARWERLPAHRRGNVFLLMWINAVLTTALQPASLVLLIRAALRVWRHRQAGPRIALRAGYSPALTAVITTNAAHQLLRALAIHLIDRNTTADPYG